MSSLWTDPQGISSKRKWGINSWEMTLLCFNSISQQLWNKLSSCIKNATFPQNPFLLFYMVLNFGSPVKHWLLQSLTSKMSYVIKSNSQRWEWWKGCKLNKFSQCGGSLLLNGNGVKIFEKNTFWTPATIRHKRVQ